MRRWLVLTGLILLMTLAGAAVSQAADTQPPVPPVPPSPAVKITAPTAGQIVAPPAQMRVAWTRVKGVLWYRVQIMLPVGSSPEFIEYRYVPDTVRDTHRNNPSMLADTVNLIRGAEHRVVITAYAPSEALMDKYGRPAPVTGRAPKYPTDLALDWYTPIGAPAQVAFSVAP